MSDLREAAQQALEALENCNSGHGHRCSRCDMKIDGDGRVVATLKAALAEPQEPVGWFESPHGDFRTNPLYKMEFPSKLLAWQIPLFIAPPQRPAEPEERNFCPRCGKRTHTHDIHTCTPPQLWEGEK